MVEDVEHFCAELKFQAFLDGKVFEQREIEIYQSRSVENISAGVAESKLGRLSEGGSINAIGEMARTAIFMRRTNQVGTLIATADICSIGSNEHVEWLSGLCRHNGIGLPVPQRPAEQRFFTVKRRQIVNQAGNESVTNVPVSITVVTVPVIGIHRRTAAVRIRGYIGAVRPGITCEDLKPATHALAQNRREAIVV